MGEDEGIVARTKITEGESMRVMGEDEGIVVATRPYIDYRDTPRRWVRAGFEDICRFINKDDP